ncbi:hypothetical protein [Mesonia aestuariivivens]|uniref:Zinc-finger domain-containing protein n=1 Tax=Mesonia aestuariivivens TaxID=2796128 RepID=A0ABS6W4E3_9FLAO|nr:hypothetical protein [Mesonia aestuariivivens]MBW2962694.1 hypothetical protein [Mesonia aestuariivivens]
MSSDKTDKQYCKCSEANCYCDKAQYNEVKDWEREQLISHLDKCPKCKDYSERNKKLTELFNKAQLTTLQEEERKELKRLLQQNLDK